MASAPASRFDDEPRRIELAQALRILRPEELGSRVARLFAYAAAGLCPVGHAEDACAMQRHRARPATPIARSANQGEAA